MEPHYLSICSQVMKAGCLLKKIKTELMFFCYTPNLVDHCRVVMFVRI